MAPQLDGNGWRLVPLRLMIGFGFVAHGYAKLSRGPDAFASILTSLGVPLPQVMAWATSLLEFAGGLSIMAGAFVVPLTLPLALVMLTAMFTVHLPYGFSSIRLTAVTSAGAAFGPIGYELNLIYIAGLLTLALTGSGRWSVDHWFRMRRRGARGVSRVAVGQERGEAGAQGRRDSGIRHEARRGELPGADG